VRGPVLRPALTAFGPDQLGHLELHHLRRDRVDRLADHVGVLIEQHPPDDLLDRHPVGTGHAAPPFIDSVERADDHRRRAGRNHVPSDLDLHHATGRDRRRRLDLTPKQPARRRDRLASDAS